MRVLERDRLPTEPRLRVADVDAVISTCLAGEHRRGRRLTHAERDAHAIDADAAKRRVSELEDELSAARESLRRVIKAQNRAP